MPLHPHVRNGFVVAAVAGAIVIGAVAAKELTEGKTSGFHTDRTAGLRASGCARPAPGWTGGITGVLLSGSHTVTERGVIVNLNRIRARNHLRKLTTSPALRSAARYHSHDMLKRGYFAHDRPGDSFTMRFSRYTRASCFGENIAWGSGSYASAASIVQGWMDSPPHRHIIMLPWTRKVGVGVSVGRFQGTNGAAIVTADFSA